MPFRSSGFLRMIAFGVTSFRAALPSSCLPWFPLRMTRLILLNKGGRPTDEEDPPGAEHQPLGVCGDDDSEGAPTWKASMIRWT